jgi:beta-xylosidase
MRRRLLVTTALVLVLSFTAPAAAISTAPVYAGDFPDPSVLLVDNTYWAYSTGSAGRNLQVMSSPDLRSWTSPVDPIPVLASWARPGLTWAPDVLLVGGTYLMYYTVRDGASGRQCISVGVSSVPAGPFTDTSSGPLLCQLANGGSIDASPVVTSAGTYLVWKSDDNALGRRTHLWSQQLSSDGRSLVGSRSLLLSADSAWQGAIIEGPSMVESSGIYYLFYGANAWDSASAAIGYAWCISPLGPCINASILGPWMASHGSGSGPSGPDVFVDAFGATRLAYHAWTGTVGYENGGVRSLWVDPLTFVALFPNVG